MIHQSHIPHIPRAPFIPRSRFLPMIAAARVRPNRRRRRWPAILLAFLAGVLCGWLARGGGLP